MTEPDHFGSVQASKYWTKPGGIRGLEFFSSGTGLQVACDAPLKSSHERVYGRGRWTPRGTTTAMVQH